MRILITGAGGQLGRALAHQLRPHHTLIEWTHAQHDISQPSVAAAVAALSPDVVINAAAWTNVDGAETDPNAAYAANALAPLYLAEGCAQCNAALVQISTNEVFAGEAGRFYREYDPVAPGSMYARSKAAGEVAARQRWHRLYVVRVAWLYGPGGTHFPAKISAAADKHGALRVVSDEFGNPTYAPDVAVAIGALIESGRYGTYHLINEGHASRFDWVNELFQLTGRSQIPVTPILRHEWPRPAMPPSHAVLINSAAAALGIQLRPWQTALADYVRHESVMNQKSVL